MASPSASLSLTKERTANATCACAKGQHADKRAAAAPAAGVTDPTRITVLLNGSVTWLPGDAEAKLEAASLKVNAAENAKVLDGFPQLADGATVILASAGSTTTQFYNYHTGEYIGTVQGGGKTWDADAQKATIALIEGLDAKDIALVIVGSPGYQVPEGKTKWHAPAQVPTQMTQWFAAYAAEHGALGVSVLNRTKAAKIEQPNCDWGSAFASLPPEQVRALWPGAPTSARRGITADMGGGYPRLYDSEGQKINIWDDTSNPAGYFRPDDKANDFLFDPDGNYHREKVAVYIEDIRTRVERMLQAHPEHASGQIVTLTIIGTGNAREVELAGLAK